MLKKVLPKSRGEAIDLQEPKFNTGKPCKRGHLSDRYTVSGSCVSCACPKIRRDIAPMRNQFRLTSMAHLPGNVVPTEAILTFFNIQLQQACPEWYARYVALQEKGGTVMGRLSADPLSLAQLDPTAAAEVPLDLYIENGWTPAQLVQHGYASVRGVEIAPAFEVPVIPPADPNV